MKRKYWHNLYPFTDKGLSMNNYNAYMLMRTNEMFRYEGLPDTIPARMLELILQQAGHVTIAEVNDELYAFKGSLGGEPDVYYEPTVSVVANPALKISNEYIINKDCVVINNDALRLGLLPLNKRYASLLVENDITMRIYDINSRMTEKISATDDRTRNSALQYLADIEEGRQGVISENEFLEGINVYNAASRSGSMSELIEYQQYLKASWFNELGLQSNYNMKRESINSNEAQLNEDALLPLIDNMLRERKEGIERVNEMFKTNITVELSSSWEDNQEELELAHEMEEAQSDINEEGGKEDEEKDGPIDTE